MSEISLYHCLAFKELSTVKAGLSIKVSDSINCIEVKLGKPPSISINKSLLSFIEHRGEAGLYALDLLLTYKLYSSNSVRHMKDVYVLSGLYGVYRRLLKFNSLYGRILPRTEVGEVLKYMYSRFDCEETKLILGLLFSNTFEEFINKLFSSHDFRNLSRIIGLLRGRESLQLLLGLLRDVDVRSISPALHYILASMIIQGLVMQCKEAYQFIDSLMPYVNSVDSTIGGGIGELVRYLKTRSIQRNNNVYEEFNRLIHLSKMIDAIEDNLSLLLNLYVKPHVRDIVKVGKTDLEFLIPVIKRLISTVRFILYYELYNKTNAYIPLLDTLLCEDFIERLAYIIAEDITSESASRLKARLLINPVSSKAFLNSYNIAVIFGSLKGFFKNLLWDLDKDAEEYRLVNGFKVKVFGVAFDWLIVDHEQLEARRALIPREDFIDEAVFAKPIPIHCCFILNLPLETERRLHKEISRALEEYEITLINPYIASMRADDKLLTHELVDAYNTTMGKRLIECPRYTCVQRNTFSLDFADRLQDFIRTFGVEEVVVKPAHGTEGIYVKHFNLRREKFSELLKYVKWLLKFDDVVIEEFRGNLLYRGKLHFMIRINVSWNGEEFEVESGYAQIAPREGYKIATTTHGGKIININELFRSLYFKTRTGRIREYTLTKRDIDKIKEVCINVAKAINLGLCEKYYLKYMGVDLVLELRDQKIIPIVLEVNSRPSGLSHSYTLSYDYKSDLGRANVIKNLIKYLEKVSKLTIS